MPVTPCWAVVAAALAAGNLLGPAQLRRAEGARWEQRIRDGELARDGAEWNGNKAAILDPRGVVEWDLGASTPVAGALLQADNNDEYIVWGSDDGSDYRVLWRPPVHPEPGLRTRTTLLGSSAGARFVRLTAQGGDGLFSVSELQLFSAPDEAAASGQRAMEQARPPPRGCNTSWWVVAAFAAAVIYFFARRRPARS